MKCIKSVQVENLDTEGNSCILLRLVMDDLSLSNISKQRPEGTREQGILSVWGVSLSSKKEQKMPRPYNGEL